MLPISSRISRADFSAPSARFRTSSATTANPRPCSPARAASIAAFRARRLVWSAIPATVFTTWPISSAWRSSSPMILADCTFFSEALFTESAILMMSSEVVRTSTCRTSTFLKDWATAAALLWLLLEISTAACWLCSAPELACVAPEAICSIASASCSAAPLDSATPLANCSVDAAIRSAACWRFALVLALALWSARFLLARFDSPDAAGARFLCCWLMKLWRMIRTNSPVRLIHKT